MTATTANVGVAIMCVCVCVFCAGSCCLVMPEGNMLNGDAIDAMTEQDGEDG